MFYNMNVWQMHLGVLDPFYSWKTKKNAKPFVFFYLGSPDGVGWSFTTQNRATSTWHSWWGKGGCECGLRIASMWNWFKDFRRKSNLLQILQKMMTTFIMVMQYIWVSFPFIFMGKGNFFFIPMKLFYWLVRNLKLMYDNALLYDGGFCELITIILSMDSRVVPYHPSIMWFSLYRNVIIDLAIDIVTTIVIAFNHV